MDKLFTYLPPATKLGQGYIFTGVCDSVHRGVCSREGGVGVSALGGLVQRGLLPGGCLVLGGVCSWGVYFGRVPGGDTSPGTATAVGSTHATGMHSCFLCYNEMMIMKNHFGACGNKNIRHGETFLVNYSIKFFSILY